jgi:hypothetical protein
MSYVTNVLLLFSLEENLIEGEFREKAPVIGGVNGWLEEHAFAGMENLSVHAGREKAMQANIYGGAYNYFDVDEFAEFLKEQSWRAPHSVQLLVKCEEDGKFSLRSLFT